MQSMASFTLDAMDVATCSSSIQSLRQQQPQCLFPSSITVLPAAPYTPSALPLYTGVTRHNSFALGISFLILSQSFRSEMQPLPYIYIKCKLISWFTIMAAWNLCWFFSIAAASVWPNGVYVKQIHKELGFWRFPQLSGICRHHCKPSFLVSYS